MRLYKKDNVTKYCSNAMFAYKKHGPALNNKKKIYVYDHE